jgi:hypothetical protein
MAVHGKHGKGDLVFVHHTIPPLKDRKQETNECAV